MKLLTKILLILALMSTPAYAANLFVPEQYPTIQEAVWAAAPGDRILVGPGMYAGARIDKWVKISGAGDDTVITEGIGAPRFQTGFRIVSGADKTEISDLTIALSGLPDAMLTGIYVPANPSPPPVKGVIRNVKFVGLARAIRIHNSSGWIIAENSITGLRDPYWSFLSTGIWLQGTGNSLIANNTVESDEYGLPHLVYVGINLSAGAGTGHVDNNKVVNNSVSVRAEFAQSADDISLFQGAVECDDAVYVLDNKVVANQADFVTLVPPCLADHNVVH